MRILTSMSVFLAVIFLSAGCYNKKDKTETPVPVTNNVAAPEQDTAQTPPTPQPQAFDFFEVVDETLVLPETDDLKEIKQFANTLNKSEPNDFPKKQDEWEHFFKLQRQYYKAVYDTGLRIFEHPDATEKDKKNALKMQSKGLTKIAVYDMDHYQEKLRQLAESLQDTEETKSLALSCWSQYHMNRLSMSAQDDQEDSLPLLDETFEFVEQHKNETSISTLVGFLSTFVPFNRDENIAETYALKLQEILEYSDEPMYRRIAANIPDSLEQGKERRKQTEEREKQNVLMAEGKTRREALPGKEMELECLLLNGDKLNLKDLNGKVVLVDFWATWCPPCIGEIPGMLAAYEKYHDDGFEIIGYSTDDDLDALRKFQEERQLPWNVASRALSLEAGLPNYSTYYGVSSIPTMILVGKDGQVISIRARGEALKRELENIFGH